MVARLVKQDETIKKEFQKKIQAKIEAEKEVLSEYKKPASFLGSLKEAIFGDPADKQRMANQQKGNSGEAQVAVKLMVSLSEEWVLMNDVIVEPEPEVYVQTDHVLIGPSGVFIVETKAWQGAFKGYKDHWRRREGKDWVPCDSPTKQNIRHLILIRKWLEDTGLIKIDKHPDEWIKAGVVFTKASWVNANGCCMDIFDGPAKLVEHIRKNKAAILSANDIDSITRLFVYPKVAKAYINREVKVMDVDEKPGSVAETGALYQTPDDNQPKVREDKTRNGRKFIKITGSYRQAEEVRQKYPDNGIKVGLLNKDKTNEGEYYFFVDEEPPAEKELVKNQVAAAKEDVTTGKRKDREQLFKELKEFRLMKAREEKIVPYLIFNNAEMEELISIYPANVEELLKMKGFGKKKVEKYGESVLKIFNTRQNGQL
jgi:hypothetical protein